MVGARGPTLIRLARRSRIEERPARHPPSLASERRWDQQKCENKPIKCKKMKGFFEFENGGRDPTLIRPSRSMHRSHRIARAGHLLSPAREGTL